MKGGVLPVKLSLPPTVPTGLANEPQCRGKQVAGSCNLALVSRRSAIGRSAPQCSTSGRAISRRPSYNATLRPNGCVLDSPLFRDRGFAPSPWLA
jgi:hypothetical protein